jgi:alanine racemase
MTREGAYADQIIALFDAAEGSPFLSVDGLYTHLAAADETREESVAFTQDQLRVFEDVIASLRSRGTALPLLHAANSPAAIAMPQLHFDMIRPGVAVYGCHPSPGMQQRPDLRQALRVRSHLSLVKRVAAGAGVGYGCTFRAPEEMEIGIVPVGYADGYDRRFSNRALMSIDGCQVPVIGRVSMDQATLDLRPLAAAAGRAASPGDEVVVIDDAADAPNNIEALAELLKTVPHEVMTRIGGRVQRVAVRRPH